MFDYSAPENHILRRENLSPEIRETLLEATRDQWAGHPRYHGKANFFMSIHRDLLNGSAQLSKALKQLLDMPEDELEESGAVPGIRNFGGRLISFAHHHHQIEDHGYFPQFTLLYPNLDRAMKLLDGDHRVLEEALHDTESALHQLANGRVSHDGLGDLYRGSKALDKILNRHIWDEEDVIIPIFLKHT
jgi:hemerythrin-like domain-containing protein